MIVSFTRGQGEVFHAGIVKWVAEPLRRDAQAERILRNRFHVFDDSDQTIVQRSGDMRWIARFEKALTANDFYLVAQPIADLHGQVSGSHFELLLRMKTDEGGIISPGIFMPSAERYHMATRIDRWVLDTALDWLGSSSSMLDGLYLCNLNISGQTVADKEQRDYFVRAISESAVSPTKLCFEITETAAMVNVMTALEFMRDLRALGCLFALDDFGSGLSSFGYLKSLPVDFVKIDGQFVKTISQDPANLAIVRSIHQVAMATGKMTVAEFVEDERTLELLREIGIDFAQGYHIGRPEVIDLEAGIKPSAQIYANSAAQPLISGSPS
jgi:EAL domain-containing protein (putative c-di-GMP-specific phosphodiesterase class I)